MSLRLAAAPLTRLLAPPLLALAVLLLAYQQGRQAGAAAERATAAVAAAKAAERQAALIDQARQVAHRQGESAMRALQLQTQAASTYTVSLRERIGHAPPLVAPVNCVAAARPLVALGGTAGPSGPAGGGVAAGPAGAAAAGGVAPPAVAFPAAAQQDQQQAPPRAVAWADGAGAVDGNPYLTLGAVSLWNSALAGADVPAAACRADALAQPACTFATSTTLAAAWDNHAANAASCTADRAQLTTIIKLLCLRAGQEGCARE